MELLAGFLVVVWVVLLFIVIGAATHFASIGVRLVTISDRIKRLEMHLTAHTAHLTAMAEDLDRIVNFQLRTGTRQNAPGAAGGQVSRQARPVITVAVVPIEVSSPQPVAAAPGLTDRR